MDKFGVLKSKMLVRLTESYQKQNKEEIKTLLNLIKENKDFRELYLFYEDFETKHFDNVTEATQYVEEASSSLKDKIKVIYSIVKKLCGLIGDLDFAKNEVYESLDIISEPDNLLNIDKKIIAKRKLVEHLTKTKETPSTNVENFTKNESLLHAVLANNFNVLYGNSLTESEKKEFVSIMSMNDDDISSTIETLKEELLDKISNILVENDNTELNKKLEEVRNEVTSITPSKLNLYRLKQLKDGI